MAIDLAALKAKIAAQKATSGGNTNAPASNVPSPVSTANTVDAGGLVDATANASTNSNTGVSDPVIPTVNAPAQLGTSKTTEIEHLDFLAKMNSLAEAIHKQHPTMPVLLMQIHKQLRNDPELVTTLDDTAIGIVVKGLQVQTKTELVAEVVKKTSSGRAKKVGAMSTDMF